MYIATIIQSRSVDGLTTRVRSWHVQFFKTKTAKLAVSYTRSSALNSELAAVFLLDT